MNENSFENPFDYHGNVAIQIEIHFQTLQNKTARSFEVEYMWRELK